MHECRESPASVVETEPVRDPGWSRAGYQITLSLPVQIA
jgi:hypothetical protein